MRLNAFTDVTLRVLMTLGRDPGRKRTTQEIADLIRVPYNHVAKAVAELRRRGLLDVTRGRSGGARITETGLAQSVGALIRELSTRAEVVDCEGVDTGTPCPFKDACALREALARAREAFFRELDGVTVRDLASASSPGVTALGLPVVPPAVVGGSTAR